jgi:hypothetical protein
VSTILSKISDPRHFHPIKTRAAGGARPPKTITIEL